MRIGNLNIGSIRTFAGLIEQQPDRYDPDSVLEFDMLKKLEDKIGEIRLDKIILKPKKDKPRTSRVLISWNRIVGLELSYTFLSPFPEEIFMLKSLTFLISKKSIYRSGIHQSV